MGEQQAGWDSYSQFCEFADTHPLEISIDPLACVELLRRSFRPADKVLGHYQDWVMSLTGMPTGFIKEQSKEKQC